MLHNFTWIRENLVDFVFQGYITALGFMFWVLFFTGIIGYVYLKQQSMVAAAVGILIIVAVFGNALVGVGIWMNLMYVFVSLAVAALVLFIFIHRRQG